MRSAACEEGDESYLKLVVKELASIVRTARMIVQTLLRQVPSGLLRHVTNMRLLVLSTNSMLVLQAIS